MRAIEYADQHGIRDAAELFKVPVKSLKRWLKVGFMRRKGGGRKTKDPDMEKTLNLWYQDLHQRGIQVTSRMVKNKARELTHCKDFVASKGWLDKFKV